jgi:REP-associated tyrosine transposase
MPRRLRCNTGGYAYHVLNRAVGRATIFHKDDDYAAFEKILGEAKDWKPVRLLGYCLLPNHWHLVVWPKRDGDLSEFLRWLTVTHTQRYHAHYHSAGTGPIYQGRFKSFPIEEDEHLLTVLRYVERNALRAGLVRRAERWRWSSLWQRRQGRAGALLDEGPLPLPEDWIERVNRPETEAELEALRRCVARGCPYGEESWVGRTAKRLRLESALRPPGRPKKASGERRT